MKNKINLDYIDNILIKIISYNYIREANNKYSKAVLDT